MNYSCTRLVLLDLVEQLDIDGRGLGIALEVALTAGFRILPAGKPHPPCRLLFLNICAV